MGFQAGLSTNATAFSIQYHRAVEVVKKLIEGKRPEKFGAYLIYKRFSRRAIFTPAE
jgi:hypothetical protein